MRDGIEEVWAYRDVLDLTHDLVERRRGGVDGKVRDVLHFLTKELEVDGWGVSM